MGKQAKKSRPWTTDDELNYIDSIRTKRLLCGYLAGCVKRRWWGAIDESTVMLHALRKVA